MLRAKSQCQVCDQEIREGETKPKETWPEKRSQEFLKRGNGLINIFLNTLPLFLASLHRTVNENSPVTLARLWGRWV